jgi:hypothetical protein
MQAVGDFEAFTLALGHPIGFRLLSGGVLLIVAGMLWMSRIGIEGV